MSVVRVTNPGIVIHDGGLVSLRLGDKYQHDDSIVRAHPSCFGSDNVESATAAPGERRNARHP